MMDAIKSMQYVYVGKQCLFKHRNMLVRQSLAQALYVLSSGVTFGDRLGDSPSLPTAVCASPPLAVL